MTDKLVYYNGIQKCECLDYEDMASDMACYTSLDTHSTRIMEMFEFNIKYKKTGTQYKGHDVYKYIDNHIDELLSCTDDIYWLNKSIQGFPFNVQSIFLKCVNEMYKSIEYDKLGSNLVSNIHQQYNDCYEKAIKND